MIISFVSFKRCFACFLLLWIRFGNGEQRSNAIERVEANRSAAAGLNLEYTSNRRCSASNLYAKEKNSNFDHFLNEPCGYNVVHLTVRDSTIHYIPNNFFMHTQAFANLLTLRLDDIAVKEIEPNNFVNITNLKWLFIARNEIQTIPSSIFKYLPNLHGADLSFNNISLIANDAFVECSTLEKLLLNGNELKTIESQWFTQMINLNYLDLSDNLIADELNGRAFEQNPNLQQLFVRNNRIDRIVNFDYETRNLIETTDVARNPLTTPVYPLTVASRTFNYHHSNVTQCFIDHRLVILDASHCKIHSISISTTETAIIEEIYLSHNLIESVINFTNLPMLNELDLRRNRIRLWNHPTQLPNLKILNLADNQLLQLDLTVGKWNAPALQDLCLYGNRLETLELGAFEAVLPHLKTIYLENNNWTCAVLKTILDKLDAANVTIRLLTQDRIIIPDNDVKGIRCKV